MKIKVVGVTKEDDINLEESKIFSGHQAGICYMENNYDYLNDAEKNLKRFMGTCKTGHHSVADHVQVTVVLENISKMLAMVLNSLGYYATSEKSGRYTSMTGNSEAEVKLYEKWLDIFSKRIAELEPFLDEKSVDKLAKENARYVLSVFTRSTTMSYTTSLRQWNYIYDWCQRYMEKYKELSNNKIFTIDNAEASFYEANLYYDFKGLSEFIKSNLYIDKLRDTKNRHFDFLGDFSGADIRPITEYRTAQYQFQDGVIDTSVENDDRLDFNYSVSYFASFVHLAQAQRHRTISYWMLFNPYVTNAYFVPPIIRNTKYELDWISDLSSISEIVPQATIFPVVECGTLDKFLLKCEERLCGRAQFEIMQQTKWTAERFIKVYNELTPIAQSYVAMFMKLNGDIKTKGELLCNCSEPCRFGCYGALDRVL